MKRDVKRFSDFIKESKKTERYFGKDQYVESDYNPGWRKSQGMGPQRYRNLKNNFKLKLLSYLWESGEEGRSTQDIKRFIYTYGGDFKGKNLRTRDEYSYDPKTKEWTTKTEARPYHSTKDRGIGSTMLYGSDWWGKPTGILYAHCQQKANGNWVLTDKKLKRFFEDVKFSNLLDQDEFDTLDQLGIFD
jgi:hypothetical protein